MTTFLHQIQYDDLVLYERCGSGTYGSVYRAYWQSMEKEVAVKKLLALDKEVGVNLDQIITLNRDLKISKLLSSWPTSTWLYILLQAEVLSKVSHRNIVLFYGIVSTEHNHCIVMGKYNGTASILCFYYAFVLMLFVQT